MAKFSITIEDKEDQSGGLRITGSFEPPIEGGNTELFTPAQQAGVIILGLFEPDNTTPGETDESVV